MNLPVLDSTDLTRKRVFLRADIDVPLKTSEQITTITDEARLRDIWPTVEYLLKQNCDVILAGHLGRPEGKVDLGLSSKPVADWFSNKTHGQISNYAFSPTVKGFLVTPNLVVLENLRFNPGEEANDEGLAKELASLAEVYINESFAACEREHASIVGVPKFLPHFAGFRLAKEVAELSKLLDNPEKPFLGIIGGAKAETKIPVIKELSKVANDVIVGGKLLSEISSTEMAANVHLLQLTPDSKDCTQPSVDSYMNLIQSAKTIVWNGPVGMVEDFTYQVGTRRLAELVAANSTAYKIVGGGDTVAFLDKLGLTEKFNWVSSGGGSMLKLLSGEKLPGVEALLA